MGRSVARALQMAGVPILGFLDRAKHKQAFFEGLPVLHPDAIGNSDVEGSYHVHAMMNHYASSRAVTDWANTRGFAGLLFPDRSLSNSAIFAAELLACTAGGNSEPSSILSKAFMTRLMTRKAALFYDLSFSTA